LIQYKLENFNINELLLTSLKKIVKNSSQANNSLLLVEYSCYIQNTTVCVEIYKYFKDSKDFGFKDQIIRTSLSIPSNITEGMEKQYQKEKIRFFEISKGSIAELITQIYIGIEIDYIEKSIGIKWVEKLNEISKMINGLSKYHKVKIDDK